MRFKALKVTVNNNLLLSSPENKPVAHRMGLFLDGKRIGEVFDTIARVERPFYLAKPKFAAETLLGKELEGK